MPTQKLLFWPASRCLAGVRRLEEQQTRYSVGDLVLDRLLHRVTRGSEHILLQPRESRLLEYLMQHAG